MAIAQQIGDLETYDLVPMEVPTTGAGFKDWFIEVHKQLLHNGTQRIIQCKVKSTGGTCI